MLAGAIGLMCFSYPLYMMIAQGSFFTAIIAQIIFTFRACASFQGPLLALHSINTGRSTVYLRFA